MEKTVAHALLQLKTYLSFPDLQSLAVSHTLLKAALQNILRHRSQHIAKLDEDQRARDSAEIKRHKVRRRKIREASTPLVAAFLSEESPRLAATVSLFIDEYGAVKMAGIIEHVVYTSFKPEIVSKVLQRIHPRKAGLVLSAISDRDLAIDILDAMTQRKGCFCRLRASWSQPLAHTASIDVLKSMDAVWFAGLTLSTLKVCKSRRKSILTYFEGIEVEIALNILGKIQNISNAAFLFSMIGNMLRPDVLGMLETARAASLLVGMLDKGKHAVCTRVHPCEAIVDMLLPMRSDSAAKVLEEMLSTDAASILVWMVFPDAEKSCCFFCRQNYRRGRSIGAGVAGDIIESLRPETAGKVLDHMVSGDFHSAVGSDLEAAASIVHHMTFPGNASTGAVQHAMLPDTRQKVMARVETWQRAGLVPCSITEFLPDDHPLNL